MKLGTFMMPLHPPERDYSETLKEDREMILLADKLGYEEAFIGEHVTDRAETITSCLMFIASLAHDTKRIKLGTGTINLPNTHPAAVAAQVAMIDHILQGRFIMGTSPGGLLSDAEVFGNLDADRAAMFLESIGMVLKIWETKPPYELEGKYWKISTKRTLMADIGQGIIMTPLQKPQPPWVASHWPMYEQGCAKAGRPARRQDWRVAKSVFIAADDKVAQRYAKEGNSPSRRYYHQLRTKQIKGGRNELFKADRSMPDNAVTPDYVVDSLVTCGTVNSVVDQLLAFRERIGDFGTLLYSGPQLVD